MRPATEIAKKKNKKPPIRKRINGKRNGKVSAKPQKFDIEILMTRHGMTIDDVIKLATAWQKNATHFANARQCADGLCQNNACQHGGSCACQPCAISRAILRFEVEMRQSEAEARKPRSESPPSEDQKADP